MSKETYFEMCEALGSQPIEEDIPVEFEDLHDEVQEGLIMYNMLQDNWDGMTGVYLGKVMNGIMDLLSLMEIDDKKTCITIVSIIDEIRSKILNVKKNKPAA